jgi:TolB-like protein/Flp pilus assembly protein TadD
VPLEPIGSLPATRDIAAGLSDELITALARIRGLRVIARESTGLATSGPRDLNRIVRELKVTHALEGSLSQSGEHLRMHLRLLDVRDGSALWAQDYDREAADVLALQQDVARAVARALTLELGLVSQAPRGGDAEFLRRFYAARNALVAPNAHRRVAIDTIEIELRALLRERPDDARIRASLASALDARASFSPPLAEALRTEALKEAALALKSDPTLPDALRVQASAAYREARWEDCIRLLEEADRYGPNEAGPRATYAMLWARLGYLERAEAQMREVLRSDPLNPSWHFGLGRILDTRGKHEEALRTLPKNFATNGPYALIFNAIWRGDLDRAAALAGTMEEGNSRGDAYVYEFKPSYVAAIQAMRDPSRWPEARKVFVESERRTGLMNFLRVFDPEYPPAKLVQGLDTTRRRAYSSWDLLMWTHDLARIRRDPAFEAYLRDSGILDYWKRHGFPPQCRPRGDGASCD